MDLDKLGMPAPTKDAGITKVWRPKRDGGHPELGNYVSVNGHTVDANQPAFDMRELTDKRVVSYCDCFSEVEGPPRYGKPHVNGSY